MPPRKKTTALAVVPAPAAPPELVMIDPAMLVIGPNVRLDADLDDGLVESVRERGVLQPISAWRDEHDRLVVLAGQRRTLAAVRAQRKLVPVWVTPRPDDPDRLTDQLVENEHRAALAAADRVRGWEQLSALGLTAAQIAKRTAARRQDVTAGLAVAASPAARAVLSRPGPTLAQAAAIAEFDGNDEAVALLTTAAEDGGFDHTLQQLRDDQREAAAIAAAAAEQAAAGVTVIEQPAWDSPVRRLAQLRQSPEEHASCPGHAAFIGVDWYEADTGDCDDDPGAATPMTLEVDIVYVCTDPVGNGHLAPPPGTRASTSSGSGTDQGDAAQDAQQEAAAAQRREVIAMNKAWDSATTVRRAWLRTFLARKTPPKGTAGLVASALGWCEPALDRARERGNQLAHELLGLGEPGGYGARGLVIDEALGLASDGRAQVIGLALVLAAYEEATTREHWRTQDAGTVRYLRYIESSGYELSEVEQRACAPAGH